MNLQEEFIKLKEYCAAGLFEDEDRSLFYRKSISIKRYYENVEVPQYIDKPLYPSGILKNNMAITLSYNNGFNVDFEELSKKALNNYNKIKEEFLSTDFFKYEPSVPKEHRVAGCMHTHSMPNFERIIKEGLDSYIIRIRQIKDSDIRDGLINVVEGIRIYVNRCTQYLDSINANKELIQALKKVPFKPADTIYEALVCWNFILYIDGCDNLGCVASGLMPYYNGEDITKILENLFDNLDLNNGYSMALGIDYNPLTFQCLKAAKGKRRPMIELFVDKTTPDEIWHSAFELVRTNGGQPAFYNYKSLKEGLLEKFPQIKEEDFEKFCGGGCTESMISGHSNVGSLDAGINLALILENVTNTELEKCSNFEEFYNALNLSIKKVAQKVMCEISNSQKMRAQYVPLPMRTLLIDDCIDKGIDYNNGGARYMWSIINFAGIINVIDSLLVTKHMIFDEKKYSADEFIELLKRDEEEFISSLKNHKICFGVDNSEANVLANKFSRDVFSVLETQKPYLGLGFLPASIQFLSAPTAGKAIGATPDGRRSNSPLCDSIGAIHGKDILGPTALLKSVTSLDLKHALGIPVLNFTINANFKDDILKGLINGYMELGGIQMQITCVSREMLMEAYENPDKHRNLVVRVGGYSEYFYRLSDELKKMIVERNIF